MLFELALKVSNGPTMAHSTWLLSLLSLREAFKKITRHLEQIITQITIKGCEKKTVTKGPRFDLKWPYRVL